MWLVWTEASQASRSGIFRGGNAPAQYAFMNSITLSLCD